MEVIIEGTQYLPIAAAAKQLATTELRILMLVKRDTLAGELVEGEWYISAASIAGYDASAEAASAVPACRTSCTASSCGCH